MVKAIESGKFRIELDDSMVVHNDLGINNIYKLTDLELGDTITIQYAEFSELIELLKDAEDIF